MLLALVLISRRQAAADACRFPPRRVQQKPSTPRLLSILPRVSIHLSTYRDTLAYQPPPQKHAFHLASSLLVASLSCIFLQHNIPQTRVSLPVPFYCLLVFTYVSFSFFPLSVSLLCCVYLKGPQWVIQVLSPLIAYSSLWLSFSLSLSLSLWTYGYCSIIDSLDFAKCYTPHLAPPHTIWIWI